MLRPPPQDDGLAGGICRVCLLGRIEVRREKRVVAKFATNHSAILLAVLARLQGRPVSRDFLADLLWPGDKLDLARGRLRVALSSLRRQLEPTGDPGLPVLFATRETVALSEIGVMVDCLEFQRLVQRGLVSGAEFGARDLALADTLYGGEFCGGFSHPWIESERSNFTRLRVEASLKLAHHFGRDGDRVAAVEHARKAVEADPLSSVARNTHLELLLRSGKVGAARLEAHRYRDQLVRETGLALPDETRKLLKQSKSVCDDDIDLALSEPTRSRRSDDLLPQFKNRYVEQGDTLDRLAQLLETTRLLTLTGPSGVGKTRLAVELTRQLAAERGLGVAFIRLRKSEALSVLQQVLDTAAPQQRNASSPIAAWAESAAGPHRNPVLLVLDGAESSSNGLHEAVREILRATPLTILIVTRRGPLNYPGEALHSVPTLDFPPSQGQLTPSELLTFASVQLFTSSAQCTKPDFRLSASSAPWVAKMCRDLEGLPLAIELAASRIRATSLTKLSEEFDPCHDLSRGAKPQGVLFGALRHSVAGLNESSRRILMRLVAFPAGFSKDDAEAVTRTANLERHLEILVSLSLLVQQVTSGKVQFRVPAAVRSLNQFLRDGDDDRAAKANHAQHFRRKAVAFSGAVKNAGVIVSAFGDSERGNFEAALEWYETQPDQLEDFVSLVTALTWYWVFSGNWTVGRNWVRRSLAKPVTLVMQAELLLTDGTLACYDDDAEGAINALTLALSSGAQLEPTLVPYASWSLGFASYLAGHLAAAETSLRQAAAAYDRAACTWWSAISHHILGFVLSAQDRLDEAEQEFRLSIHEWEVTGESYLVAASRLGLARIDWHRNEFSRAHGAYQECLDLYLVTGDFRMGHYALEGLARCACSSEHFAEAAQLLGTSERLRRDFGVKLDELDTRANLRTFTTVESALGDRFREYIATGQAVSWQTLVDAKTTP